MDNEEQKQGGPGLSVRCMLPVREPFVSVSQLVNCKATNCSALGIACPQKSFVPFSLVTNVLKQLCWRFRVVLLLIT